MGLLDEINGLTEEQMSGMPWDMVISFHGLRYSRIETPMFISHFS